MTATSRINTDNLTLNPKEVASYADLILETSLRQPEITEIHTLHEGIVADQQIGFVKQLGKVGILDSGCERPNSGATIAPTQKKWQPKKIGDTLIHCSEQLNALFKAKSAQIKKFMDYYEITGTPEEAFIVNLITEALKPTVLRAAWLGDTDVAQATGSVAGLINGTANSKFYNYFNGFWKQIFTAVNGSILTSKVDIDNNNLTTVTAQKELPKGYAVELFEELRNTASYQLRGLADSIIYVSGGLFRNYTNYLTAKGENFTIDYTLNGFQSVTWDSKKIVNMETVWDYNLEDFVGNTSDANLYLPHRAILTSKENLAIGTVSPQDFKTLESFYEQKERSYYFAFGFGLDAKLLNENMIAVAY